MLIPLLLTACFKPSPSKLNQQIESGSAAKAMEEINKQLVQAPSSAVLNLLAAKAQLALCAQANCPATKPNQLSVVPEFLDAVHGPAPLEKGEAPLTAGNVIASSIPLFAKLSPQPAAMLALYKVAPPATQPDVLNAMFTPALNFARNGNYSAAADSLQVLGHTPQLPAPASSFALALAGMFENQPADTESQIIGLRSLEGEIPATAAALVPWALLAQTSVSETSTAARSTLQSLPATVQSWKVSNVLTERAKAGLTQELNTIRTTNALAETWAKTFGNGSNMLNLTLQRLSLSLNPNQPDIWSIYLPALLSSTASGTVPDISEGLSFSAFSASSLTSDTQERLAGQLLQAATTLQQQPGMAAPLVVLAGSLSLNRQQKIDIDKLTQQVLIKAANQSDVTATALLAKFKPEVALNNRQVVVPLLLANIRQSLRTQNFAHAIDTAELLHTTLEMDVQLDPLVLEEFADDMKRQNISTQLDADTADVLLQDEDAVALDLGPLFTFMQDYFAKQPAIITAQLTTLIANAHGVYGPATAMYRLNHLFSEEGMPQDKRTEWLNQAITEAVVTDTKLTGPEVATLTLRLTEVHPGLSPAPLLEAALRRTNTLDENRAIWKNATGPMRDILRTIRPQFTSFMRGVDAYESGRLGDAAATFSEITEPQWYEQAKPYLAKLQDKLADLSGIYVPVSALSTTKAAAIILSPAGLNGGALQSVSVTLINRMGTLTQANPTTLNSTPAAIRRISFAAPFNFDTQRITLTPDVLEQIPESISLETLFGNITAITLQPPAKGSKQGVLQVSVREGSVTNTIAFTRTLVSPGTALRPDGTYLIQSLLNKAIEGTETILPRGTVIIIHTGPEPQATPSTFSTPAPWVYPLTGTLNHPSTQQPIYFEGAFDPATLALEFTFSYPLPSSKQPVKAAVRCQALAGPIVCGAHHLHSPRLQFATLVAGMQTQESLAQSAKAREALNDTDHKELLSIAAEAQPLQPLLPSAPVTLVSATVSGTLVSGSTVSVSIVSATAAASPTVPVSATAPMPVSATVPVEEEEEEDISETTPTPPVSKTLSDFMPKEPTTITIRPGEKISGTVAPGVFIHKTSAKPVTTP